MIHTAQAQTRRLTWLSLMLAFAASSPATSTARGGPAAPTPVTASSTPAKAAQSTTAEFVETDDKDINPFTGQSLSEAQLRRTLEREKLVTAIASEKTKQTQSNSELQMARLRNAAEKSRLATEKQVLAPLSVQAPAPAKTRSLAPAPVQSDNQPPNMVWSGVTGGNTGATYTSGPARAEIKFADELVELKSGPARNPSVVASVDAQRSADQNQPRAIAPISVAPAALPAVQMPPSVSPIVPPPSPLQR
jgi:hypothetical protein